MRRNPELAQRSRAFTKRVMSRVFDVRMVRGIKQSDLAHRVGINRGHLANMASGRNTMSAVTLFDLATELEVPVAALIPRPAELSRRSRQEGEEVRNG